ncbi:hypothetical protein HY768_09575 [candidate division TA06 bacterium]|uniref:Uncharacterized protein n=1 Tax=candidate division TA06 bacterium TaxID=2250710 RepID=A0A933MLF7_UNCT6|nr:hypothetical protein [candidate division TA06 bacterium]
MPELGTVDLSEEQTEEMAGVKVETCTEAIPQTAVTSNDRQIEIPTEHADVVPPEAEEVSAMEVVAINALANVETGQNNQEALIYKELTVETQTIEEHLKILRQLELEAIQKIQELQQEKERLNKEVNELTGLYQSL